jgi:hypothetical protein
LPARTLLRAARGPPFSRPIVEQFMAWAQDQYEWVKDRRGLLRSAFGYIVR